MQPAAPFQSPAARPLRVCLFTDTLADVNGVARFVRDIAAQALARGRGLHLLTSTRGETPDQANIHNARPRLHMPMPGYPLLDLAWPDTRALRRAADRVRPDVVHVSTPGPVGWFGRRYALSRGIPLVGTHHTDFPAYVDHLFADPILTRLSARALRFFYRPFSRILVRSEDGAPALEALGVEPGRIEVLPPGIETSAFTPRARDPSGALWARFPAVRPASVKALYVGRVSVEKNLPWLARLWPAVRAACAARAVDAQLLIVGDGPYRAQMQSRLAAHDAVFLGFRHGAELSAVYASSDLFIFPSATDTLGQSVMEAQASGLPAIVADRGGPARTVVRGQTGFVLPLDPAPDCQPRWIDAAVRLSEDRPLRERMGAAAAARIAPMTIARSFDRFWSIHESVAAHADGSSR